MSNPLARGSVSAGLLETLAAAIEADAALPELPSGSCVAWLTGGKIPVEEIEAAAGAHQGVSLLLYLAGGEVPDSGSPTLVDDFVLELFVSVHRRNLVADTISRSPDGIREALIVWLHQRELQLAGDTTGLCPPRIKVTRWDPLDDPDYVASRIRATRVLHLD